MQIQKKVPQQRLCGPNNSLLGGRTDGRGEFIRLVTRGRVTGLPHIVELRYAWDGGSYYVIAGSMHSDWVLNGVRQGVGVVRIGDLLCEVSFEQVDEAQTQRTLNAFRTKYSRKLVAAWYTQAYGAFRLTPISPFHRRGSARGELEAKTSLTEWRMGAADYYGSVAAAFDAAAEEYDFTIGNNFINTWIRKRSIEVLLCKTRPHDFLMEVGAGTGAEAIEVARHVRGVLAMDVSQSMIDLIAAKVKARHLENKVFPIRLAAFELPKARELLRGNRVRVAYSFNGALNCEPKLEEFVAALADMLEPEGVFVCSLRNTLCLTEAVLHAAAFQFDRMNPRKHQPMMVSVGGKEIPSTYYSSRDLARKFKPYFRTEEIIALPGLLPPAYLNSFYLKLRNVTSVFEGLDRRLSSFFPLNRFGDQTLFVFRKKD
jgi:ubiquinone/menaquinone biosynthesis C-methylase UbiE